MSNPARGIYRRIVPTSIRRYIRDMENQRDRLHRVRLALKPWGGANFPANHPFFFACLFQEPLIGKETIEIRFNSHPYLPILVRPDSVDLRVFRHVFLAQHYADILKLKPDATTILDLGANVGYSALWFAMMFPQARIYALEPAAENFSRLQEQVSTAGLADRIQCLEAAISDVDGKYLFYQYGDGTIHDGGSLIADSVRIEAVGEVDCLSLASILERFDLESVDVIKLDAEGIEEKLFTNPTPEFREIVLACGVVALEPHGARNARLVADFFSASGWNSTQRSEIVYYYP